MARFSTVPVGDAVPPLGGKRGPENRTGINWNDPEARKEYYRQRYRRDPKGQQARIRACVERQGRVLKTLTLTRDDAAWVTEYGDGNFNEGVRRLIAKVRGT